MFDEKENFEGEGKIAAMLSSLKRVDAPGDFDTHVRARIASGRVSEGASVWATNLIRVGAFAAVAGVITVGGYFVLTSINTGQNDVPAVAETRSEPQNSTGQDPSGYAKDNETGNGIIEKPTDEMMADKINADSPDGLVPSEKDKTSAKTDADRPTAGSTELAVRESKNIYPRGLNPNTKPPANAKGVDPNARIHVASILEFIGVKATWAGGGWRVDSVDGKNIAGRSGIKGGDVIEALNDKRLEENSTFPAKFDGKSMRVRRDGSSVQIDFKP